MHAGDRWTWCTLYHRQWRWVHPLLYVCLLLPIPSLSPSLPPSPVSPNYSLSDFLIESVPLQNQLEQETHRYEYETSPPPSPPSPTNHQLVSCLAAMGQWVTSQPHLQLDPPVAQLLFLKGGSLHFLFEPVWTLSAARTGDYLTILANVMDKLETGVIRYWHLGRGRLIPCTCFLSILPPSLQAIHLQDRSPGPGV